jgi:hypothetical protein
VRRRCSEMTLVNVLVVLVFISGAGATGVLWHESPIRVTHAASIQNAATDQAAVSARDALQRYADALQSLDAAAVKRVQPAINTDNLAKAFRDMRELKVEIDSVKVLSTEAATMRVSCRVTQTLTPKAGSRQTTAVTRVIRLRRDASAWVIDAFER